MKCIKKILLFVFVVAVSLCFLPSVKLQAASYGYEDDANGVKQVWWYYKNKVLYVGYEGESYALKNYADLESPAWTKESWYENVEKIVIRPGITAIGDEAFEGCDAKEVEFEGTSTCTRIGCEAFSETGLLSMKVPKSVKVIDDFAFEFSCIKTIAFESGSKLETIGSNAFSESNLESITLPSSLKRIKDGAFMATELKSITIPRYSTSLGTDVFRCCRNLQSISVDKNNKSLSSKNGVLFNKKKTKLIQYPAGKSGETYTVPSSVTTVTGYAFVGDEALAIYPKVKTLKMSKKIKTIGAYAFVFTDINKIYFPGNRPKIGEGEMFDADQVVTIYYKKSKWPAKYRKNYGAKKVIWKKY